MTPQANDIDPRCRQVLVFDRRAWARLTETGLQPIDQALTFTSLAAEMRVLADRIGVSA